MKRMIAFNATLVAALTALPLIFANAANEPAKPSSAATQSIKQKEKLQEDLTIHDNELLYSALSQLQAARKQLQNISMNYPGLKQRELAVDLLNNTINDLNSLIAKKK